MARARRRAQPAPGRRRCARRAGEPLPVLRDRGHRRRPPTSCPISPTAGPGRMRRCTAGPQARAAALTIDMGARPELQRLAAPLPAFAGARHRVPRPASCRRSSSAARPASASDRSDRRGAARACMAERRRRRRPARRAAGVPSLGVRHRRRRRLRIARAAAAAAAGARRSVGTSADRHQRERPRRSRRPGAGDRARARRRAAAGRCATDATWPAGSAPGGLPGGSRRRSSTRQRDSRPRPAATRCWRRRSTAARRRRTRDRVDPVRDNALVRAAQSRPDAARGRRLRHAGRAAAPGSADGLGVGAGGELKRVNQLPAAVPARLLRSRGVCTRRHLAAHDAGCGLLSHRPGARASGAVRAPSDAPTALLAAALRDTGLAAPRCLRRAAAAARAAARADQPARASHRSPRRGDGHSHVLADGAAADARSSRAFVLTARRSRRSIDRAASLSPPRTDITYREATATAIASAPRRPDSTLPKPLGRPSRRPYHRLDGALAPTVRRRPAAHASAPRRSSSSGRRRPARAGAARPPSRRCRIRGRVDSAGGRDVPRRRAGASRALLAAASRLALRDPAERQRFTRFFRTPRRASESRPHVSVARARPSCSCPVPRARRTSRRSTRSPWAPQFPQPMSEPLAELSQDLLLPGLDAVPPNTVLPLETNNRVRRRLHGRAQLPRWRASCCGAAIRRRSTRPSSTASGTQERARPRRRISSRSTTGATGRARHAAADSRRPTEPTSERFVLLVRSELLRRYPERHRLRRARTAHRSRSDMPDVQRRTCRPTCASSASTSRRRRSCDGDAIVIQEQPTEPRFGVEVGTDRRRARRTLPPTDANAAQVARADAADAGARDDAGGLAAAAPS